jgi:hypothetical protein
MFKLEKELKSSEITNEDNHLLREAKQLLLTQSVDEVELLDSLGLKNSIQVKRDKVQSLTRLETLQNDYGKIYNIKDIEKIALEYNLKFLKIERYNKEVPVYLAPSNHFKLEKDNTPLFDLSQMFVVDPAVFVEVDSCINAEKFSLIYSWGDDLNLFNLLSGHFNKNNFRIFLKYFLLSLPIISFILSFFIGSIITSVVTAIFFSFVFSGVIHIRYLGGNNDTYSSSSGSSQEGKKFWKSYMQNKRALIFKFPWE